MTDLFNAIGLPEQRKPIPSLTIRDIIEVGQDGFIPDWRLAEVLEYDSDREIRRLIDRHRPTLEARWGKLCYRDTVLGRRGPAANVCLLNRKQALFITAQAQTRNAVEVLILIIEVFDAWVSGKLRPADAETAAMIADAGDKAYQAAPELMKVLKLDGQDHPFGYDPDDDDRPASDDSAA